DSQEVKLLCQSCDGMLTETMTIAKARRRGEYGPWFDFVAFFNEKMRWSRETFGRTLPWAGIIKHLRKEIDEAEKEPLCLSEWIDIVLVAIDGAGRAGYDGAAFAAALVDKLQTNRR